MADRWYSLDLSFLTEESWRPKNGIGPEGGHMSATSAVGAGRIRGRPPMRTAPIVRGFVLGTVALDLAIIAYGAITSSDAFRDAGWGLVAWAAVVAVVGAASLPFESGQALGLDMPVLLSVGYLFGPIVAGAVAFVAYIDQRELRGETPFVKALFNRAQTSLSVMAATAIFVAIVRGGDGWPITILAAFLAVGTDCLVNYGTVVGVLCLHERISPLDRPVPTVLRISPRVRADLRELWIAKSHAGGGLQISWRMELAGVRHSCSSSQTSIRWKPETC